MANIGVAIEVSEARAVDAATWRAESVCRKHPTQWWFAGGQRETLLAKAICEGCAVRSPCLAFALDRPELLGIWAATTPPERAALRRAQREAAGAGGVAAEDPGDIPAEIADAFEPIAVPAEVPAAARVVAVAIAVEPVVQTVLDLEVDLTLEHGRELEAAPRLEPEARAERPERAAPRSARDERYELLTPAEAARLLGVTPNTVTRWSRAGSVSAIQTIGGHRRFRRSEIERVLRDANIAPADN